MMAIGSKANQEKKRREAAVSCAKSAPQSKVDQEMVNWQAHLTPTEQARLTEIDQQRAELKRERDALANRARQRKFQAGRI